MARNWRGVWASGAEAEMRGGDFHISSSIWALALMLAFVVAGCSTRSSAPEPLPQAYRQPSVQLQAHPHESTEVASWYGSRFAGRRTSNGERFDPNALTAASKTLPLGSHVKVTNPSTGKSVVVRINDRGPHCRGRSLDLSRRAAEELGMTRKGVARVRVASMTGGGEAETRAVSYRESIEEPRRIRRRRSRTVARRHPTSSGIISAEDVE